MSLSVLSELPTLTIDVPRIALWDLPEHERPSVWNIQQNLHMLESLLGRVEVALRLYDSCSEKIFPLEYWDLNQNLLREWRVVALRDGVMTIYHINDAINNMALPDCPTYSAKMDHTSIRKARRQFRKSFPNINQVRNNIAHIGETATDQRRTKKHSTLGPVYSRSVTASQNSSFFMSDSTSGRTYMVTYNGKMEQINISWETYYVIHSILRKFVSGFQI